jgi:hypothetical protein
MTWTQQRRLVNSLSGRAQEKKRETRRLRASLKVWTSSCLGSPEAIVWLFAAGAWWGAGRSGTREKGSKRRSTIAAINTSLLAWQLVNRELKLTRTSVEQPVDGQR